MSASQMEFYESCQGESDFRTGSANPDRMDNVAVPLGLTTCWPTRHGPWSLELWVQGRRIHCCGCTRTSNSVDARSRQHGSLQLYGQMSKALAPLCFDSTKIPDRLLYADTQRSRNSLHPAQVQR